MDHSQLVQSVRQHVLESFRQLGATTEALSDESLLIRDGYYCGRRFQFEDFEARWFAEANTIEIFSGDGSVVESVNVAEMLSQQQRQAA